MMVKPASSFECAHCGKKFVSKCNLKTHILRFHVENYCTIPRKASGVVICSVCKKSFTAKYNLKIHIITQHVNKSTNDVSFLLFPSLKEFEEWKEAEELNTVSKFVRHRGAQFNSTAKVITFYCHRSGKYKSDRKNPKRALKISSSPKIGAACSARMTVYIDKANESVRVEYHRQHTNHQKEIRFQPVPKNIQEYIADKLKEGIPVKTILDQLRDDYDENGNTDVQKKHLINRKHVYNIAAKYGILQSNKRQNLDAVDLMLGEFANNPSTPVIFYKKQSVVQPPLRNEDFMLILMTDIQKKALKTYAHKTIHVDSTHGTNPDAFNLITLVVMDEFEEGFPCAFCISSRVDETSMKLFFDKVREAVGESLSPEIFMSDDAPSYFNAWITTMQTQPRYHLLCKWQIIQNWRKNLNKIVENDETDAAVRGNAKKTSKSNLKTRAHVMKNLLALLETTDEFEFNELLRSFLAELNELNLRDFEKYFTSTYVPRKKMWAACYRKGVMVNTSIALEEFHNVLNHIYSEGRKNKRIDALVTCLLTNVRDRYFDQLAKIHTGGKVTNYVIVIGRNHSTAVALMNENKINISRVDDVTWSVESETKREKRYKVRKLNVDSDCCEVTCIECQMCMHAYSCTCFDYEINNNICKHIHFTHLSVKNATNSMENEPIESMYVQEIQEIIIEQVPFEITLEETSFNTSLIQKLKFIEEKLTTEHFDLTALQNISLNIDKVIQLTMNKENLKQ